MNAIGYPLVFQIRQTISTPIRWGFYHVLSPAHEALQYDMQHKKRLSLSNFLSACRARWGMGRLCSDNLRMIKFSEMLFSLNRHSKCEKGYMDVRVKSQTESRVEGKRFHFSVFGWMDMISWVGTKCQKDERRNKENSSVHWARPVKGNSEYRLYLPGIPLRGKISLYTGAFGADDSHPGLSQAIQSVAVFSAHSASFALKRFMVEW